MIHLIPALKMSYPGEGTFTLDTPEMLLGEMGYTCIIGKNGSGKSSFGEALSIQGHAAGDKKWHYLPQYLERFLFAENLVDQLNNLLSQEIDRPCLKELLQEMGFSDPEGMLEFPFLLLSGGERRRMALACVFYIKPKFLILDEPEIGVTTKENMVLLSKINNLQAINGRIVVISHNYEFVKASTDLICLRNGRLGRFGATQALLSDSDFNIKDYGVRFEAINR